MFHDSGTGMDEATIEKDLRSVLHHKIHGPWLGGPCRGAGIGRGHKGALKVFSSPAKVDIQGPSAGDARH